MGDGEKGVNKAATQCANEDLKCIISIFPAKA
jgi:hypothetical protein